MKQDLKDKDSKIAGVIGTILVHLLLLLLLFGTGIITVVPQEEEGLTVNYGTSEWGEGLFEPAPQSEIEDQLVEEVPVAVPTPPATPTPPAVKTPQESKLQTQDIEESLQIKEAREKAAKEKEAERIRRQEERKRYEAEQKRLAEERRIAEQKRKAEEAKRQAEEAKRQKAKAAAKNAFGNGGKGTNNASTGEGITGKPGNQGNPFGDVNSKNRVGGGSGNGNSWNLNGRSIQGRLPLPNYTENEQGIIVVTIEVNAQGQVISAKAGAAGTTIANANMRAGAEAAARRAKFDNISGNTIQTGTITYRYKLK